MIPFPKLHIAESALNRLLNALDDNKGGLGIPLPPPVIPDTTQLGLQLNEQLSQPPVPATVPPEDVEATNAGMLESSIMGGSPFDGALLGSMEQ